MTLIALLGDRLDRQCRLRLGLEMANRWKDRHGRIPAVLDLSQNRGLVETVESLGRLGDAAQRMARVAQSARPRFPDLAVLSLGLVDAAQDPAATPWLNGAESAVRTLVTLCPRVFLVVPAPVGEGIGDAGRWSRPVVRRWSRRIPRKLPERVQDLVDLGRVTALYYPGLERVDDAWLSERGVAELASCLVHYS